MLMTVTKNDVVSCPDCLDEQNYSMCVYEFLHMIH